MPSVFNILTTYLPGIFTTKCFNKNNHKFIKEVENTEIGHLFEHIILEYFSSEKKAEGLKDTSCWGITCWDWSKDQKGTYYIKISAKSKEKEIFYKALIKSMQLLNMILGEQSEKIKENFKKQSLLL